MMDREEIVLWPEGAPLAEGTGLEHEPALTVYPAQGKPSGAAVIVCPGGGYVYRAEHEGGPIAERLSEMGIAAFVLRYRVAPYRYPCAKLDVQRAIRTVRHRASALGVDPARVGVLGFSAGGHVASTAGVHYDAGQSDAKDAVERLSSRPDLTMLCYPVITMQDNYTHQGSRESLLGTDPDPELIELLSNERHVTPDTPPAFLWHTSDDGAVPVDNSLAFATALRRNGVLFDLHVYASGRHGMGLAEDSRHVSGWSAALESWLRTNGFVE
ncbi:alpha/beta hydrolase [Paenibacillus sambharensis]|nr:alpha/beta hydrolase [Paenibacillus sambharensis]